MFGDVKYVLSVGSGMFTKPTHWEMTCRREEMESQNEKGGNGEIRDFGIREEIYLEELIQP